MTHVAEAVKNPSEITGATSTWLKANDFVSRLDITSTATHEYAVHAWSKMDELYNRLKQFAK